VCLTDRKKKIKAIVFKSARQITSFVLFGLNEILDFTITLPATKTPIKNLKKEASIAGISVPVQANFTNTVAAAKLNSANNKRIIPFRIIKNKGLKIVLKNSNRKVRY
jgi:hypothetical protein